MWSINLSAACRRGLTGLLLSVMLLLGGAPQCDETPASPGEGGGLRLLDAVRETLVRQPLIHIESKNVDIVEGALEAARGEFDVILGASVTGEDARAPLTETE